MVELIKQAIADNSKVGNMMSTYIEKKMMGKLLLLINEEIDSKNR